MFRQDILRNPAQIMGLVACDEALEGELEVAVATREPGKPLLEPAVADSANAVAAFAHLGWRGKERLSNYLGVRALTAKKLVQKNGNACFMNATETSWHSAGR